MTLAQAVYHSGVSLYHWISNTLLMQYYSAIYVAALSENLSAVHAFLDSGVDVNARDFFGSTSLHWVAWNGNTDIARLLIEHGANIEAENDRDETPIIVAFENGHHNFVRFLQQYGAILPEYLRGNGANINGNQSVHTVSVHEGVAKSALALQDHYQLSPQNIAQAHQELNAFIEEITLDDSHKINAAKRGLARLQTLYFIDQRSGISMSQAIALTWRGLTDKAELLRKRKERGLFETEETLSVEEKNDLTEAIVDWLYHTQRNYNISRQGVDNQKSDSPSCVPGSFNQALYALNGRHSLVNIPVVNEEYIYAQVPPLAKQFFDGFTDNERNEYADASSQDTLAPALIQRLHALIEQKLHENFDEFHSDGLNVNQTIDNALAALPDVPIPRLERMREKQEKQEAPESSSASSSSSSIRPE